MEALPKEFYCPITQELMNDPVIGPDGQTYERSAIVSWLQAHGTSPITRQPMSASNLVPNRALKATIQDMLTGKQPLPSAVPQAKIVKSAAVPLSLQLSTVETSSNSGLLHISVVPPEDGTRHPCAFICALDVSGSMDEPASNEEGLESSSFSRLDLVKHSVKTVINMLSDNDYLALISFNEAASVCMQLSQMTESGKMMAIECLEGLHAGGNTNIWDALRMSTNLSRLSPVCNALNSCILVFTDGEPNVNPPRGITTSLNNLLKNRERLFSIHTFGYGYQLDSELLMGISQIGHGCYNYIPDCSMVGTVFVNFISNALATAVRNARLEIKATGVSKAIGMGCDIVDGKIVVGAIEYGQSRDFIVQYEGSAYSFSFDINLVYDGKMVNRTISSISCDNPTAFNLTLSRCLYCDLLSQALGLQISGKDGEKVVGTLKVKLAGLPTKDHDAVKALFRDIESAKDSEGQVGKAFSKKDWFDRWGKHYLRSLIRAHQLQQCHNFKDPGVQVYGGKLFREMQDKTDEIFCALPAPKPSAKKIHPVAAAPYVQPAFSGPVSMSHYLDYGAGCFDGEGIVRMADGSTKKVMQLRKGDELVNSDGKVAKVVALVVIKVGGEIEVVDINGVKITPWHPVRDDGTWKFPKNLKAVEKYSCDKIYNLVLDQHHIVTINGVDLVTLGHGFKESSVIYLAGSNSPILLRSESSVIEHAYFGTQRVIEDLMRFPGWNDGNVRIEKWVSQRNEATGLVQGILHQLIIRDSPYPQWTVLGRCNENK